jgi:hypothetical protein
MLSENRKYHFIGEFILNRSHLLEEKCQPKDDKVNWLFIDAVEQQFSFVYKIEKPLEAKYGTPFKAELAFTMIEAVRNIVKLNYSYNILRGQEIIGDVRLIKHLE